jgi:acyl carrier protein
LVQVDEIQGIVKSYILEEFLEGEDPDALEMSTELMTGGILDSLATLKLITYLEERFGVEIEADEADEENLNTIADIASLVNSKL